MNDNNVLSLLSCESGEIFLRYFKAGMNALVRTRIGLQNHLNIPEKDSGNLEMMGEKTLPLLIIGKI